MIVLTRPHISPVGSGAILFMAPGPLDLAHQRRIWAMAEAASSWPGVQEAVPGMTNLMLVLDTLSADPTALEAALLRTWDTAGDIGADGRLIDIPVIYGGDYAIDLAAVAAHTRLSPVDVVQLHAAGEYTVFALGSAPGFAYLGGLDPRLHTPRKRVPSLCMLAGTVTIGGAQTGVSALTGPNGWNSIGFAEIDVFDPAQTPPALMAPGDRVRFRAERILL
jgi:KipI family sensor histidine kinase inhibitor